MVHPKMLRACWMLMFAALFLVIGFTEVQAREKENKHGRPIGKPIEESTTEPVDDSTGGEEVVLVESSLTALLDNGFTPKEVLVLLADAGITGLQESDIYDEPMAGLEGLETFTDDQLTLLQADISVSNFLIRLGNPSWGPGDAGDVGQLTEAADMTRFCLSNNRYQAVAEQLNPTLADFTPRYNLDHLIKAAKNMTETVTFWARNGEISDPVAVTESLVDSIAELALHYYTQENRGDAAIEEAIIYDILPDIDSTQYPQIDFAGWVGIYNEDGTVATWDRSSTDDSSTDDIGNMDTTSSTPDPDLSYLPVFPGAMGHGTATRAGRGGKILRVTNLNDSGVGSLRAAIDTSGPRIIVFEVSGTIKLSTDLSIRDPYVTLAGQTAPSPGINLRGAGIRITTHDVLVQHIRIRTGDDPEGPSPVNRDALQVLGPNAYNVVVDHVSLGWGIDENASTWYALEDVTFSNCIISEGLSRSTHPKGEHSKGFLLGDYAKRVTFIGNLLAHNVERMPRVNGSVSAEVVNNVMYNIGNPYEFMAIGSSTGPSLVSVVGNKFIAGPDTKADLVGIKVSSSAASGTKVYIEDNQAPGKEHGVTSGKVSTPPIWHESLVAYPSSEVEQRVLDRVGARPADRDAVDTRIVKEVRARTGSILDSPSQAGGWPVLPSNYRVFIAPSNPHGDDDNDGYTNIEEVIHQMAAAIE